MSTLPLTTPQPTFGNRIDHALMTAQAKVAPATEKRIRGQAQDFEAMMLNSMFEQMFTGLKGDGPMGDTPSTGVWRSMLIDQHAKSFAKQGGVGIANDVYRTLMLQQAARA